MLPLVLYVNVVKVGLSTESKTLSDVTDGHDHLLVDVHTLDVFDIGIDQFLVELYVLELGSDIHHMQDAIGDIMV